MPGLPLHWFRPAEAPPPPAREPAWVRVAHGSLLADILMARARAMTPDWPDDREDALLLLNSHLSDTQRHTMQAREFFDVTGSSGRRWRIFTVGQTGNVALMEPAPAFYCAHPAGVCNAAAWLAQMITLQTDEEAFLAVANPFRMPMDALLSPGMLDPA